MPNRQVLFPGRQEFKDTVSGEALKTKFLTPSASNNCSRLDKLFVQFYTRKRQLTPFSKHGRTDTWANRIEKSVNRWIRLSFTALHAAVLLEATFDSFEQLNTERFLSAHTVPHRIDTPFLVNGSLRVLFSSILFHFDQILLDSKAFCDSPISLPR